ncbi:MAG: 2,3-bisphosphoglycerate-independent phosphoglycerate mutase [Planctomycetota bacterium]|jgi:2,3-bisphosphoglycerate-independent phosphoglycerate mutase
MAVRKGMLMILDGWGIREEREFNAIAHARTPHFDRLKGDYPFTRIVASGIVVGLPEGMMGNSEVGHLNLGAGRIVWQEVTRINRAIQSGEFFENHVFLDAMGKVRAGGGRLHLMGLVSDGGVHSYELHFFSLLEMAKAQGIEGDRVMVHAITDGRDTPPVSGIGFLKRLEERMKALGVGRIATVVGRYYTMDRDRRWDRLEKGYRTLAMGEGNPTTDWAGAMESSYGEDTTDEFILPIVITEKGEPIGTLQDGDSLIFFNFRADRGREISYAFTDPNFPHFPRPVLPRVHWVCMTEYDPKIPAPVAFPPQRLDQVYGEQVSQQGLSQLHIAETEKYAHVTFFFNGGREAAFSREERVLVPSPRVPRYNQKPEMSAREVTQKLLERLEKGLPDFTLINYANPDMVGHTGDFNAAVKAIEVVDEELGKVVDVFTAKGGIVFVTSDHGNAELMFDADLDEPHTAHTTNPVPLITVGEGMAGRTLREGGRLCDIVPTLAPLMEIETSQIMEGENLLSA